jgi:hypothetical protein
VSEQSLTDEVVREIADKHGWTKDHARRRILRTQEIFKFTAVADAVAFLREAIPGSGARVVDRITEIALHAGGSPKTIHAKGDGGSCRSHDSTMAEEIDQVLDELPEGEREEALEAAEQKYNQLCQPREGMIGTQLFVSPDMNREEFEHEFLTRFPGSEYKFYDLVPDAHDGQSCMRCRYQSPARTR